MHNTHFFEGEQSLEVILYEEISLHFHGFIPLQTPFAVQLSANLHHIRRIASNQK